MQMAAAYVRGMLGDEYQGDPLFHRPLADLSEAALETLFDLGQEAELRLHRFKRTMDLARVRRVLGMLQGLQPQTMLDIGTGRGAFLWPLLDAFPALPVTALDVLDYRVRDLQAVARGGIDQLQAFQLDVHDMTFEDEAFDGVTLLETLEHISEPQRTLDAVCRVAKRFVIVSVPSKEDDNPEHIHLFTPDRLRTLFLNAGMHRFHIASVLNHIIVLAFK